MICSTGYWQKICRGTEKSVEETGPDWSNSKDADVIVIDNNDADSFRDENHDPYDISGDNIDVSLLSNLLMI